MSVSGNMEDPRVGRLLGWVFRLLENTVGNLGVTTEMCSDLAIRGDDNML